MRMSSLALPALVFLGCGSTGLSDDGQSPNTPEKPGPKQIASDPMTPPPHVTETAPAKKVVQKARPAEKAPAATAREDGLPSAKRLTQAVTTWFTGHIGRRMHVQTDKPIYKPGETIWFKVWDLKARDLRGDHPNAGFNAELVSPKGATVRRKRLRAQIGVAANDFVLPDGVQGGEYKLRVTAFDGQKHERPIVVSVYEPPRIKKKLEFVRKAYGAGDAVTATITIKRPTGEPLGGHPLRAHIRVDGVDLEPVKFQTNAEGGGLVRFTLPKQMERGDGLLTVLVEDGGVTESVSKRVPIVLKKVRFAFFPEGGRMVEGLPTRLYFEAKNTIGKPADVEGRVVDDAGNPVARFSTFKDGLGRIDFTPGTGRTYQAEITRPVGVTERYPLPLAEKTGCVLRTFDDLDGQQRAVRAQVKCSEDQKIIVAAVQGDRLIDAAAVQTPAVVHLSSKDASLANAIGVARVTVFDADLNPLAERVVFRNRRSRLAVKLEPSEKTYTPRQQVAVTVTTTGPTCEPQPAELAVAVVDDTVLSFADDKTGHMLSRLLLEPEVPGKIEEPNFYLDLTEKKSALALELLMGTRGWRKFEWRTVLEPPKPVLEVATGAGGGLRRAPGVIDGALRRPRGKVFDDRKGAGAKPRPKPKPMKPMARPAPRAAEKRAEKEREPPAEPAAMPEPEAVVAAPPPPPVAAQDPAPQAMAKIIGERGQGRAMGTEVARGDMAGADKDWDEADRGNNKQAKKKRARRRRRGPRWAPVRVFPVPVYPLEYAGPRTDFRETVYWSPVVRTGKDGKATITFPVSDAITSFRVFAEGVGGGAPGRAEKVIASKLPFSMNVKLPLEVSQGDIMKLPLTLSNEVDRDLPVSLNASFGDQLTLKNAVALDSPKLAAHKRASLYYDVEVTGVQGESAVMFAANAGGLKDEFTRRVNVVPLGFPQSEQRSGTSQAKDVHTFDLGEALPGSINVSLKLYASPVSTLLTGIAGLVREPHGCFEQTSATHYPNVMVKQYMQANDVADAELAGRIDRLLDKGYQKLVGFEAKSKGYEWFGRAPAHEALTAYGLLEFSDMRGMYAVDEGMLRRTRDWLKKRRDGKGGFLRDGKALDSFGRASPEVTNAYIRYSLAKAGLAAEFQREIDAQVKLSSATKDPYLLALAANTLLALPDKRPLGLTASQRLLGMQADDGSWPGANHSITRSGGVNLTIETTALALLALVEADGDQDAIRRSVQWLNKKRGGHGQWGATQATVLTLKALTEYATKARVMQKPGEVFVTVNGVAVPSQRYAAGRREPLAFDDLAKHFRKGKNTIEVTNQGATKLPYSIAVDYRSLKPATAPDVAVSVKTRLEKETVKMGESVRLVATVSNTTDAGQPMTVARVGLPGGLTFQNWQLKELREKGLIAFYETRAREVVLYFDQLKPKQVAEIPIDLVASVPGTYTGPASSAYLYYTNDKRYWTDGLKFAITR